MQEAAWWAARVSKFKSAKNARPDHAEESWPGLSEMLTTFLPASESPYLCIAFGCYGRRAPLDPGPCPKCDGETSAKIGTRCWSPARYPEGVNRARARVIEVSCLVLDYDDGTSLKQAHEQWKEWPHIMHTSWSHSPEHHKFRVVLPLLRPIPADSFDRAWHWAFARAPQIDTQCKDPSRIYFLPAHPDNAAGAWGGAWEGGGRMLDLDPSELPKTPEEVARERAASRPRPTIRANGSAGAMSRQISDTLKTDAGARLRAAEALGATIRHGSKPYADHITCPACGDKTVHFLIQPGQWNGARCSHRNSCKWTGWIDQLLMEYTT